MANNASASFPGWTYTAAGSGFVGAYSPAKNSLYSPQSYGSQVYVQGPRARISLPASMLGAPATLAAGTGWVSPVIDSMGFPHIAFGMTSSAGGTMQLFRYLDSSGSVSIGAAATQAASAGSAALLDNADGKGFWSFAVGFTNTSASTATLSSLALLMFSS